MNMDICVVGKLISFLQEVLIPKLKFQNNKVVSGKIRYLWCVRFLLFILFVLGLDFDIWIF